MTFFHHGHMQAVALNTQIANLSLTVVEINVDAIGLYSSRFNYLLGFLLSNVQCVIFCLYEEMVMKHLCA